MDVFQAAYARRTVRSFRQAPVDKEILAKMVDAARVGPSAANRQPLHYFVVTEPALCAKIFDCLKWAAYTAPKGTPAPGKTPTAYVVMAYEKDLAVDAFVKYDVGAAVQTMLLVGLEEGVASCWLKSVNYAKVKEILGAPDGLELDCVVAFGYPDEEPTLVNLDADKTGLEVIKYWRDAEEKQFVPKRALGNVLHWEKYGA